MPRMMASDRYEVATRAGERRVVDLGGQGTVALNGSTRLTLDRGDPRYAALESGEATFTIHHDAAKPFTLQLGDDRVQDVGTVFNVVADEAGHRVEVAEGAVVYNPQGAAVSLKAGQTLFDGVAAKDVVVRRKDSQAIGGWQRGRLDYESTPIATIASDLSRNLGVPITVTPELASRPFTGTIMIDRHPARMLARLSLLLDADVQRSGRGWVLGLPAHAPR
jgi:transmembrane sensor